MEARLSLFHPFPRVSRHTQRLATKTATALRDGAGLAGGAVLRVHARTRIEKRRKEKRTESAQRNRENIEPLERSGK